MGVNSTRISVLLSGAPNDDGALQTSLCLAAQERCDLHIMLAESFPKGRFLRRLDTAMWEVTKRGLPPPRVSVERRHRGCEAATTENAG